MKRFLLKALPASLLAVGMGAQAADHKDSVSVDSRVSGDIADVFAFVDPSNTNNVILSMTVNVFTNPNENPGMHFEESYLYQIKIDNDQANGAKEDLTFQFEFTGDPNRSSQPWVVKKGLMGEDWNRGPRMNMRLGADAAICGKGDTYDGGANSSFSDGLVSDGAYTCFAGVTDDPFQTDVAQAVFRIGLEPEESDNVNKQDVFRFVTSGVFGELRGRPLRNDDLGGVNSGVDGFGGFNVGTMAISVPKEDLRGTGILDASQNGAVSDSLVGIWGTVSRPKSEQFDGFAESGVEARSQLFHQFERMGQQLFATVFIHDGVPFNTPEGLSQSPYAMGPVAAGGEFGDYPAGAMLRDLYNATGPKHDVANWDYLIFDTVLDSELVASTDFNTVEGRATLLTAGSFVTPGTGTPLLAPDLAADSPLGKRARALGELLLPDYLRLSLDEIPDAVRPGAAAAGNSDPVFGIGRWGVQNGRRPNDDVTDIYLRIAREFADVKFPDNLVLEGLGITEFPGSSALGSRRALDCTGLDLGIAPILGAVTALDNCDDSRIFAVLQGTDFTEPTQEDVDNLATQVQLRDFTTTFPYMSVPHPISGEPGTTGFPNQHEDDL